MTHWEPNKRYTYLIVFHFLSRIMDILDFLLLTAANEPRKNTNLLPFLTELCWSLPTYHVGNTAEDDKRAHSIHCQMRAFTSLVRRESTMNVNK